MGNSATVPTCLKTSSVLKDLKNEYVLFGIPQLILEELPSPIPNVERRILGKTGHTLALQPLDIHRDPRLNEVLSQSSLTWLLGGAS